MDLIIFNFLNSIAGKSWVLDKIIVFFAEYLGGILIFGAFFLVVISYNTKREIQIFLLSIFSALISRFFFTEIIRFFYQRQRPFVVLNVNQIINHSATPSFPSGHTAFYFALAFTVYLYHKKAGIFFLTGASLISISRVIGGIHWPSDILAGAVIGCSTAIFVRFLFRKLYRNFYHTENLLL